MIVSMARDPPPPEHNKTTSFTAANTNAALKEAFRILAGPEQLSVLSNIVLTEAAVVAKQVTQIYGVPTLALLSIAYLFDHLQSVLHKLIWCFGL